MPARTFLVARNPEPGSRLPYLLRLPLPYLLRLPLPDGPLILKAREPWPRTSKVYCHRADPTGWPADAETVIDSWPPGGRCTVRFDYATGAVTKNSATERATSPPLSR